MTETLPEQRDTRELPPSWNPAEVEGELYARWVAAGYFTADSSSDKPPFSIVIPPPNVTGSLHIGHAFEHSLMDALVRRKRMQGFETCWLPGMDHASIPVHALVERQLAAEGTSRRELGREKFLERVWEWKNTYGGKILNQMRRLGDSVDWSRERFTMDEGLSRAVQTIFKRLYDDGLIYRAERMINWSPVLRSALSDAEVDHKEVEGELVSMRYGDGDASIVVATTRVETMLGDTAVAVHPDDERYVHLVGTEIELPLTGRSIPIVADTHVDPEFGTGAVKVTPAHDPNDFAIGQRHDLPMPTIMDEEGRIANTGTEFDGMDRFEARVAIREALRAQGRIVAEKRPYLHSVGHSERSKEPIEPRLSLQWFVKVEPLARSAGDLVRSGTVTISPKEADKRYFDWVDNLHDWCISRQLWWGHRIPVWYGPNGEQVCLGPDEQPPAGWTRDEDVLDTWFSSGLWPFSTFGWPEQTKDLAKFYPTSVLVTGYDILFFWVIRMMMFGGYAMDGQPPFHQIALHGMVRDKFGKKMSKSNNNGVDPIEWLDRYGADALRFTMVRGANPGVDVPIGEENVENARRFTTKLWNATRFALSNGATVAAPVPPRAELTDVDRWILDRTDALVSKVDGYFEDYEFAKLAEELFHFTWDEFCDWYLELAKVQIAESDERAAVDQGRPRPRARRAVPPAAPVDALRHRDAVDHADRRRIAGRRGLADRLRRGARRGRGAAGRVGAEAGHRDPPLPQRSGPRAEEAGADRTVRHLRGWPAPARAGRAQPGLVGRARRGLQRHRDPGSRAADRHRHRPAGHLQRDRRRRRTQPADQGPRGSAEGTRGLRQEAGRPQLRSQGTGQRGRQDQGPQGHRTGRHRAHHRATSRPARVLTDIANEAAPAYRRRCPKPWGHTPP